MDTKLEIVTLYGGNLAAKWCNHYRAFIGYRLNPDSNVIAILENLMPHGDACNNAWRLSK